MKDYDAIAKLQEAIEYSGNKWSEWGERAEHVGELLDEALAILRKHDEAEAVKAGDCLKCGGPVYHRPGKPGEYDHMCEREAEANGELYTLIDKLCKLGNGDMDGNSDGNRIAQKARALLLSSPAPRDEKALLASLQRITNRLNRITCPFRHQHDVRAIRADDIESLYEAQLEAESILAREAPKDESKEGGK